MRNILLPEYLRQYNVWDDLASALDTTWEKIGIDDAIQRLQWLRNPINTQDLIVGKDNKIKSLKDITQIDRPSMVMLSDLLGFRFYETSTLNTQDYLRLCVCLADYYSNDKGTPKWTDFISWCLAAKFEAIPTFTTDYKTFYMEGDPAIGKLITQGGEWYPTTHVVFKYDATAFAGIEPSKMVEFFYYFANINLVLWMTQLSGTSLMEFSIGAHGSITCYL